MDTISSLPRPQRLEQFLRTQSIPRSYQTNTPSEDLLLEFVDDFSIQYHRYYPNRRQLLLTPLNECQTRKMICTFIRPSLLKFDEFFDMERCSKYIAGYMRYEPLHDPVHYETLTDDIVETLPDVVVSPATALQWQVGNCLEMSLVLSSLLAGAGYNVYVVVGYAQKEVCLNDQTQRLWSGSIPIEHNSDEDEEPDRAIDEEYASLIRARPILRAATDHEIASLLPGSGIDPIAMSDKAPSVCADVASRRDTVSAKLLHVWVAVLSGGRKSAKEVLFIEPSTGEIIKLDDAENFYVGVESIFNSRNYFVNLAPDTLVGSLSFDVKDTTQWESVILHDMEGDDADLGTAISTSVARKRTTGGNQVGTLSDTLATAEASDMGLAGDIHISLSWVKQLTLSLEQYKSGFPGFTKVLRYADAEVRVYAEYSQEDCKVQEIIIPDVQYHDLYQMHIFYKHRMDKLRRRSIFPQHPDQADDSMYGGDLQVSSGDERPAYRLIHEWYEHGRMRGGQVEGLREYAFCPGKSRTMKFYWKARQDGLQCREELFYDVHTLRKVKEFYRKRKDLLYYRSASFGRPVSVREASAHNTIALLGSGLDIKQYPRLEPIRCSQKFLPRTDAPSAKDVAKTTFHRPPQYANSTATGEMWVFFHCPADSIIRPYHMYAKASSNVEDYIVSSVSRTPIEPPMKVFSMPGAEPPSELESYNERKWLTGVEASCLAELRAKMEEAMDILVAIGEARTKVGHVLSSYDTLRNRPKETEAERARKFAETARHEESRRDYLAPYIAKLVMPEGFDGDYLNVRLTREQAKQVRDEALLELKERLIKRGHIMQSRMDEEKVKFNERQLTYQKNCDLTTIDSGTEAEEFALYCKQATWRMKVLDERLGKHIEQATERYGQLAQRLANDHRLAALYDA